MFVATLFTVRISVPKFSGISAKFAIVAGDTWRAEGDRFWLPCLLIFLWEPCITRVLSFSFRSLLFFSDLFPVAECWTRASSTTSARSSPTSGREQRSCHPLTPIRRFLV